MLYNTLHNRWLRILAAVAGQLILCCGINLFIVPMGLYNGGLLGVCQLIRTLLQDFGGLTFGQTDIAGILYFILNIPIILLAAKTLGRRLVIITLICTTSYSLFSSLIPIPVTPIIADRLTSCLLGGILTGLGSGITLTAGGSGGGLDVLGLCMSKRGSRFTVGKFSLSFNCFLYAIFLFLFEPEVTIYSVIYNYFTSMMVDRMHQQNVTIQALIFTHGDEKAMSKFIMEKLVRGVTSWDGVGAYTGTDLHILCVCLSKYEIEDLHNAVHAIDPNAFITVQEGVRIYGNFLRKLS